MDVPLTLYVHLPWCERKCPYCDFNSHPAPGPLPERELLAALRRDLAEEAARGPCRPVHAVYFGGGTPSLLSPAFYRGLLEAVRGRLRLAPGVEITIEANPGTVDRGWLRAMRRLGVNRLSLGVQSLDDAMLRALGRIHDAAAARAAVREARAAGFDNLNIDLMYGLPGQDREAAEADLEAALALAPDHVSYYQLTLEPGTAFHRRPPPLPGDDALWAMQLAGERRLRRAGLVRYEVSAYARPGRRCRHNLNYWRFGDYLGVGPGAHGKRTAADGTVLRRAKPRAPAAYLAGAPVREEAVAGPMLALEFALNALRLPGGFERDLWRRRTGRPWAELGRRLARPAALGLVRLGPRVRPTRRGLRHLDGLLALMVETVPGEARDAALSADPL
ncbi:oxygen-independent coproporphyrinogen-3 oxidase [Inmirania thermothiophila]|uniref:Heme chaperone HemW n=1 Tax=Inmirania thermothiophila TaxID=1750597 RepID=A0A3N1Y5Q2_9GAMM|nr:radical SAM family heme chaperone HemW [Inmirania thermothiophila]ROR34133.1 oxygen-independent coproporphyrinogen-3 oxidase [Inmirania thermothiophila]